MKTTAAPVFRMKPMYRVLLTGSDELRIGLLQLYKATPEQLTRLHYSPGSIKAVKARLKTLVNHGYVQASSVAVKHETPNRQFFSARYFYTLAPAGVRYLAALGLDIDEGWRPHNEADKHGLFVEHTLAVNDVVIAAALLRRADPRFYLGGFLHERLLKHRPYAITLPDGRSSSVIPDAFLDFRRDGTTARLAVLLEHDRGTEERAHFKRKIQAYIAFIKARGFETAFDSKRITIAFTTFNGEGRLSEMRQWTKAVLDEGHEPASIMAAFRFATLPQPLSPQAAWLETRWHYAIDDSGPQPFLAA